MTDYEDLYKRLAREILKHEGRIDGDAGQFVTRLVKKLQAEGRQITPVVQADLTDYLTAMQDSIKVGIVNAATLAAGTLPAIEQSALVARLAEDAYTERWPDGLRLSDRLWKWQDTVRTGLTQVVQDGIKAGESVNKTLYAMQRTIERAHGGQRFKIVENYADDWVTELHEAAVALIHDPQDRVYWNKVVGEAEDRILELKATGSRHAAERVLDQMKKAVLKGKEELADKAAKWWLYDKQLYHLKRIARTEMATALHKAVIASVEGDASIIGFQWRLSASHPVTDICDYFANIEMGLGKGVFTKEAVPQHKAHPHCMCLLIPRVTAIKQKGSKNYADFINNMPEAKRNELLPKWIKSFNDLGMPFDRLVGATGPVTRAALKAQMGEERFNAVTALSKALTEKQWPVSKLKPNLLMTKETMASLHAHSQVDEVRRFLTKLETNARHVDSREWHYFRYKYHFGDTGLGSPGALDKRFSAVLSDADAQVHRPNDNRFVIISKKEGRLAITHNDGKRITVYDYNDVDLEKHGAPLWQIKDLIM